MSTTDKVNSLFWLNYAQAIRDIAKANYGESSVFFVAGEAQTGPPAGNTIPEEYTNKGLFDIGNNLLATDNLFYAPSALHGYAQALSNYLDWVDLEGKPNDVLDGQLLEALKDQKAAQAREASEDDIAFANFKRAQERGRAKDQDYPQWVANGNAPAYVAAVANTKQISSTIQQIQAKSMGAKSNQVAGDRAELAKAFERAEFKPGYNMKSAVGKVLSAQELIRLENLNQKPPAPASYYVPYYHADAYNQFVQAAQRKAGGTYDPANSHEITVDTKKETSDFNFSQTKAHHDTASETLNTTSETSQVKIKMLYDELKAITISPGAWNIDVSQYKLRKDAPSNIKTLVRPSQLIVATRFGYEIQLGAQTSVVFNSKLKATTTAGGSVSILGLPINFGGSGSNTTERATHSGSWDAATKTIKVIPADCGTAATVIGIVGEKFTIL